MIVHEFTHHPSIINHFIKELRDKNIQKDAHRFRTNLERMGFLLGYEISKELKQHAVQVETPLGTSDMNTLQSMPVLATVFRAGLPMHQGLMNCFDQAESAFVSAYRKHSSPKDFSIEIEYLSAPSLEGKVLIISDTMIATGNSIMSVYKALLKQGKPSKVYIAATIASKDGIEFLKSKLPDSTVIFVGAIDEELTAHSYIVPGLGDAGDLCYGEKL